jgi:hypothetical protein
VFGDRSIGQQVFLVSFLCSSIRANLLVMQGFAGGYFLNYRDFDFLTLFPLCVHSRSDHLINLAPMGSRASKTSKISSLERSLEQLFAEAEALLTAEPF